MSDSIKWAFEKLPSMSPVEAESVLTALSGIFSLAGAEPQRDSHDLIGASAAGAQVEAKYRTLVEQIPAVIFMAFLDRAISEGYVSPHIEQILGYTQEEWLGDPIRWYDRIHPDDQGRVSTEAAQLFLSGQPLKSEYRVFSRDGRLVWFRCEVRIVRTEDGRPWFIHGVAFDITELKRAEEELRRAHEELETRVRERTADLARANEALAQEVLERKRAEEEIRRLSHQTELILNSAGDGIFGLDPSGSITFLNPAAAKALGWEVEELIGQPIHAIVHTAPGDDASPAFATFLDESRRHGNDVLFLRKGGTVVPVEYTSTPIREGGVVVGAVITFKDISERKHLEEQLLQSQKMEAVGRLAGGVAHDFNNLLTIITGYSALALNRLEPVDPLYESISEIRAASERASDLTRQLLAFSRRQVIRPQVLDLNLVVANTKNMLGRLIGEDIDLRILANASHDQIHADRSQIEQVIVNLAVNARDAMPRGGKLTIETSTVRLDSRAARDHSELEAGTYVSLAVADTGVGMDEATLSHIFEPFFTTKEIGRGTGLGLAIVYGVVKQNGGTVTVSSELGKGTIFRIYLPLFHEGAQSHEATEIPADPLQGTETILLVEDEGSLRKLTQMVLSSHGYRVIEAGGGAEAVLACERHDGPIHLLLTDVVMPTISGPETAERIVALRPSIRVIFMSGYAEDTLLRHGVLDADFALLEKPFTPLALSRKVRDVLDDRAS